PSSTVPTVTPSSTESARSRERRHEQRRSRASSPISSAARPRIPADRSRRRGTCDRGGDEKWRRQSSEYGPVNARRASRESEMRPLRYSINVTLDGCCHHEAGLPPDEESM